MDSRSEEQATRGEPVEIGQGVVVGRLYGEIQEDGDQITARLEHRDGRLGVTIDQEGRFEITVASPSAEIQKTVTFGDVRAWRIEAGKRDLADLGVDLD